jgi:hypothetical protein
LVGVDTVLEFLERYRPLGNVVGQVFESVQIAPVYLGADKGIEAAVMPREHALDDVRGNGLLVQEHPEHAVAEQPPESIPVKGRRMNEGAVADPTP